MSLAGSRWQHAVKRLAAACQRLRWQFLAELTAAPSALPRHHGDWRCLPGGRPDVDELSDALAQVALIALLVVRADGARTVDLATARRAVAGTPPWLAQLLDAVDAARRRPGPAASLAELQQAVAALPDELFAGAPDDWLYFYERLLAAYDPQQRRRTGSYYTPAEVVRAQLRLTNQLLVQRLGIPAGLLDPAVLLVDPAVGTGTYLRELVTAAAEFAAGGSDERPPPGWATQLARNIMGCEIMAGPAAAAEIAVRRALAAQGAHLPTSGAVVQWADVLATDWAQLRKRSLLHGAETGSPRPPARVCVGNPPYHRHGSARVSRDAGAGGWVRWGDPVAGQRAILDDFVEPVLAAGRGRQVKNVYNQYVYFWRWALWWALERPGRPGPGIISLVTAASFLEGDAFGGMRQLMRRLCDEIWVLDLGGENRGPRKSGNVFAIRSPVAITFAIRYGPATRDDAAPVHYARVEGGREDKLESLDAVAEMSSVAWKPCPAGYPQWFRPAGQGAYFDWPRLADLFPWQHSGVQLKRTWPIAPDRVTLERRWRALLRAADRQAAFRPTGDRDVDRTCRVGLDPRADRTPIAELPVDAPLPPVVRYGYRSFDRQYVIADARLMSRPRPVLWAVHGERQIYLTTLFSQPLGSGPALTATACIPDLDHFRGSYGAKATVPLYRDAAGSEANLLPGLLDCLADVFGREVTASEWAAYVYGLLAQPAFTSRYAEELTARQPRVPVTRQEAVFGQVARLGRALLCWHTFGERFASAGRSSSAIPPGAACCVHPFSGPCAQRPPAIRYMPRTQTLHVGDGQFAPVAPGVFEMQVSGLRLIPSWLKYRLQGATAGRKSPLDAIRPALPGDTLGHELLALLWVLEATATMYPRQAALLAEVAGGPCFRAAELPQVPESARRAPRFTR